VESKEFSNYRQLATVQIGKLDRVSDDQVYEIVENIVYKDMRYQTILEKEEMIQELFNAIRRYHIIQPLLDDKEISEIMINRYDEIYIEKKGVIQRCDKTFETEKELDDLIQKMVSKMDRKVNEKEPICDVRLECGSRVNIVLNPIAIGGSCVTIRKFPEEKMIKEDIIGNKTISKEAMDFLEILVKKRFNIFVSGGTSSGKTTLLNILSDAIGENERVITIEDSAELRLEKVKNLVRLEARIMKDSYNNNVTIRKLIKASLRMRPDRIVVGEVRGEETIDMLQCMNTGHDGSLSTGHANSIHDMLSRIETMVLSDLDIPLMAIRQQIASALDIMIHIQKISSKGRRIMEISEIIGLEGDHIKTQVLYEYSDKEDCLIPTGNELKNKDKLRWN